MKALTDVERKSGLGYALALADHESRDTNNGYVNAPDAERVRPLKQR